MFLSNLHVLCAPISPRFYVLISSNFVGATSGRPPLRLCKNVGEVPTKPRVGRRRPRRRLGRASAADFVCTVGFVILPPIPVRALNRARRRGARSLYKLQKETHPKRSFYRPFRVLQYYGKLRGRRPYRLTAKDRQRCRDTLSIMRCTPSSASSMSATAVSMGHGPVPSRLTMPSVFVP